MKQSCREGYKWAGCSGQKGVTLLEIILSLAILGIISTAFLSVFTGSYSNIYMAGQKNQAMSHAAAKMERLYSVRMSAVSSDLQGFLGPDTKQCTSASLFTYEPGKTLNFMVEPVALNGVDGYRITLVSFYRNGARYAKLVSFVREG